jgi:hypothetical protein
MNATLVRTTLSAHREPHSRGSPQDVGPSWPSFGETSVSRHETGFGFPELKGRCREKCGATPFIRPRPRAIKLLPTYPVHASMDSHRTGLHRRPIRS